MYGNGNAEHNYQIRKDRLLELASGIMDDMLDVTRLSKSFISNAATLLNADVCTLFLRDGQQFIDAITGKAVPLTGIPGAVMASCSIVNTAQPERHPKFDRRVDSSPVSAYLCMPLTWNGEVFGVARALRYQCGVARGFTLQDEHLFHCFVSLSSQAFKTTDGFRMMESKLKACEAQVLMSTQMAMDGLHCDTLVRTIMEHTKKLTSAQECSLFIAEVEKGRMFAYYSDNASAWVPIEKGIAGHVASTAAVMNVTNASQHP
jgi:signal transduction protein with GAF and PtsI domain